MASAQINGIILDKEHKEPLPGVTVHLALYHLTTITDENGAFLIDSLNESEGTLILHLFYVGYEPLLYEFDPDSAEWPLLIYLQSTSRQLGEVLILEDHAKHEATLSSVHLTEKYFERNNSGTLAQALRKIPGMQSLDMGPGIGKPVIRGLHGNRIIVNKDYIKQEGQQWGTDHGLEIDPFDAQRIEIVKGPASLQYGSDGLGGALNILPNLLPGQNTMEGSFRSLYKSNNQHKAVTLYLAGNRNAWFFTGRGSIQDYEDFRVPAEAFIYNGFELPLYNQRLKNTAGTEKSLSFSTGHQNKHHVIRLNYSVYDLKSGIFSGAVGIPRSYILTDDGNPNNIDVPYQEVQHHRLVLNQIYFLGRDHFTVNAGFQVNNRREHSQPESHSQYDIPPGEDLAVGLLLSTYTLETHYEKAHRHSGRSVIGINGQYQVNERRGFEFLLPDFLLWRLGSFYFLEQPLSHHWTVSAGARYDLGHNRITEFYMPRFDRQGNMFAETFVPGTSRLFHNWSASAGAYFVDEEGPLLRFNLGKSFRIPYPNETSSNGIHHGNFRHELGNTQLVAEEGYQLDASMEYAMKHLNWQITGYFNYFDNYIYLRPTSNFSNLPEAGLIFEYMQNDAIYTGFEVEYELELRKELKIRQAFEYVHSFNIQTRLALPFTPPSSLLTEIHSGFKHKSMHFEGIVTHHYFANTDINRTDRFEQPTPSYHLFDVLFQIQFMNWLEGCTFQFQIQNVFDVRYLNHMSRYRLLNVPEQGRNFIVTLKIPFGFAL